MKARTLFVACAAACVSVFAAGTASAAKSEQVEFASLDEADGEAVMVPAYLYPAASSPAPAVVLFHGCGGLLTESGKLQERYAELAEQISGMGYTVLMPDSFGARGEREICTIKPGEREIKSHHRWRDAYGALRYLNAQPAVVSGKIAALGFSHGGTVALQVVDDTLSVRRKTALGYAASVTFYPGCKTVLNQKQEFKAYAPMLMMVGELDDWTDPKPCQELAERARAKGQPVDFVIYPGAYHGFDRESEVRVRTDVTHGANGINGVRVGGNTAAREDSTRRMAQFLATHLGAATLPATGAPVAAR